MNDLGILTKKKFITAMKKGWRKLGYVDGHYWATKTGVPTGYRKNVAKACAVGAAAYALGVEPSQLHCLIPNGPDDEIPDASYNAGTKTAAIRAIMKISWGRKS